jgi:O-succinylbenzoic acid--CoA ligase
MMQSYFEDSRASQAALGGGWLRTGDLGRRDRRGRLVVEARRVDLILSGGENIYPAEVEAVLLSHAAVAEAAVVAAQSEEWGQVPVAFVVQRGAPMGAAALELWCRERLAGFKVPRQFVALAELPRLATGKVDRSALRALVRPVREQRE